MFHFKNDFVRKIKSNSFLIIVIAFSLMSSSYGQDINYSKFGMETSDNKIPHGLKVGDKAPDFTGYDQTGKQVELKKLLASGVIGDPVHIEAFIGYDLAGAYGQALMQDPEHWVVLCSGYEFRIGLETLGPNVRALLKPFDIEEFDRLLVDIEASRRRAAEALAKAKLSG